MTVLAFASFAGSPGVTTAAFAAAVHWVRPVIVFEADSVNATSAMAGFFRSNLRPDSGGLDKVAVAYSRNVLTWQDLVDPSSDLAIAVHLLPHIVAAPIPALPAGHRMWVVPGFYRLGILDGVRGMWARFPHLFRALSQSGIDVIVDLGRIAHSDVRLPILDGADQIITFAVSTMVDLNRVYRRLELPDLAERLEGVGRAEKYRMVLIESAYESVPWHAFAEHLMPLLGELPFDPGGAAVFSLGRPDTRPQRNSYRQGIRRLVATIDEQARSDLDKEAV
ncbi:hypothetical protein [Rathayibacter soli]|uniref:hypothetical protein n=1 Tax=Rathayibacter soli TaxID=3144168 RepID=UPI0027E4D7BD|nr:hypothetical protein [Glaciibacter superstes]